MALRKRRSTPAGSPPPSQHHHALLVACPCRPALSSLKYVLCVTTAALLLLLFAVSRRREADASCRLCLLGEGEVREYRNGDGGLQHLLPADSDEDGSDDEGGEFADRALTASHLHTCPRLFHEKQTTAVDLMHALNNLMQESFAKLRSHVVRFARELSLPERVTAVSCSICRTRDEEPNEGEDRITREEMDYIAKRHVSADTSFGNHRDDSENVDAEVIQAVAASRGKAVDFIDSAERLDREIDLLDLRGDLLLGFLLHLKSRPWIAVRHCQGLWYNFDRTKVAPLLFCDGAKSVHTFLHKVVDDGGLIVTLRKPRLVEQIMLAEKPPPSWIDVEFWKYWLFG